MVEDVEYNKNSLRPQNLKKLAKGLYLMLKK